ncbi:hypothetical protein CBL_07907 [Carabus blaptoides fortunei]
MEIRPGWNEESAEDTGCSMLSPDVVSEIPCRNLLYKLYSATSYRIYLKLHGIQKETRVLSLQLYMERKLNEASRPLARKPNFLNTSAGKSKHEARDATRHASSLRARSQFMTTSLPDVTAGTYIICCERTNGTGTDVLAAAY